MSVVVVARHYHMWLFHVISQLENGLQRDNGDSCLTIDVNTHLLEAKNFVYEVNSAL